MTLWWKKNVDDVLTAKCWPSGRKWPLLVMWVLLFLRPKLHLSWLLLFFFDASDAVFSHFFEGHTLALAIVHVGIYLWHLRVTGVDDGQAHPHRRHKQRERERERERRRLDLNIWVRRILFFLLSPPGNGILMTLSLSLSLCHVTFARSENSSLGAMAIRSWVGQLATRDNRLTTCESESLYRTSFPSFRVAVFPLPSRFNDRSFVLTTSSCASSWNFFLFP